MNLEYPYNIVLSTNLHILFILNNSDAIFSTHINENLTNLALKSRVFIIVLVNCFNL